MIFLNLIRASSLVKVSSLVKRVFFFCLKVFYLLPHQPNIVVAGGGFHEGYSSLLQYIFTHTHFHNRNVRLLPFQIFKMQSAAFTLSPSLPLRNHNYLNTNRLTRSSTNLRLSAKLNDGVNPNGANSSSSSFTRKSWSLSPSSSSSSSFKFRPLPLLSTSDLSPPKATSESAAESADSGSLLKTLQLGSLFGLWYLFNIYFNIYNKQVLAISFHEIYYFLTLVFIIIVYLFYQFMILIVV